MVPAPEKTTSLFRATPPSVTCAPLATCTWPSSCAPEMVSDPASARTTLPAVLPKPVYCWSVAPALTSVPLLTKLLTPAPSPRSALACVPNVVIVPSFCKRVPSLDAEIAPLPTTATLVPLVHPALPYSTTCPSTTTPAPCVESVLPPTPNRLVSCKTSGLLPGPRSSDEPSVMLPAHSTVPLPVKVVPVLKVCPPDIDSPAVEATSKLPVCAPPWSSSAVPVPPTDTVPSLFTLPEIAEPARFSTSVAPAATLTVAALIADVGVFSKVVPLAMFSVPLPLPPDSDTLSAPPNRSRFALSCTA